MAYDSLTQRFAVRSYEVEPDGRLRLVSLLRMLQEVAWLHAQQLGKGYAERESGERYWVLARLRAHIERYPRWGERFSVLTQPVGTDRLLALREFQISGGTSRGSVSTGWLVVDGTSGRPIRPQALLADIDIAESEVHANMAKLTATGGDAVELGPYPVRHHDIDQYRHVNNAAYIEWMIDALAERDEADAPSPLTHVVSGLDVDYISETTADDSWRCRVEYRRGGEQPGSHIVEIIRDRDSQVACRAHLSWTEETQSD